MIDQPKPTFEHDDSDMDSASIPTPLQPKPTTGEATDKSYAANKIRSMHEQLQQALTDARKTPEYAEEKASEPTTGEWTAEALARQFHELYESYACEFAYETRQETRAFNPTTPNGRIMIAVCKEIADAHKAALTAAISEAQKPLVDALSEIALHGYARCSDIAKIALAKVKERRS